MTTLDPHDLIQSSTRRLNDLKSFQLARLAGCKGPLDIHAELAEEMKSDLESIRNSLEVGHKAADYVQGCYGKKAGGGGGGDGGGGDGGGGDGGGGDGGGGDGGGGDGGGGDGGGGDGGGGDGGGDLGGGLTIGRSVPSWRIPWKGMHVGRIANRSNLFKKS